MEHNAPANVIKKLREPNTGAVCGTHILSPYSGPCLLIAARSAHALPLFADLSKSRCLSKLRGQVFLIAVDKLDAIGFTNPFSEIVQSDCRVEDQLFLQMHSAPDDDPRDTVRMIRRARRSTLGFFLARMPKSRPFNTVPQEEPTDAPTR